MKIKSLPLAWFIWSLGALFYAYEYLLQVSPGVMVPELMHDFNVNATHLGNLVSFYFYAYAIMQIPAGVFLDYFGPRKLLTITCLLCAIGALIFAGAYSFPMAAVGRVLIGAGSAFAILGTFKLAANWFPLDRFALICGLTLTIGMLGASFAGLPLAYLITLFNWRTTILGLAVLGLILSAVMWLCIRDAPPPDDQRQQIIPKDTALDLGLIKGLSYILQKKQNWIVCIYGGLMFAPTSVFGSLWGISFLMAKYHLDRPFAALITNIIFFGWIVGSPFFGLVSDSIKKRLPTLYIGTLGALMSMLLIIYAPMPIVLLCITLFAFGFFSGGFLPAFSIMREINPARTTATGLGFMNALNMIGGALLPPLIGWCLDLQWSNTMQGGVRIYDVTSYYYALLILPLIIFISFILIPFIRETHCRPINNQ